MLYFKRKYFDDLGKKIGLKFSKLSISPNQWSLLGLFLVLISFYFLINQNFLISGIIFIFAASIDMIDGAVARATKKASVFGAYIDTVVDRIVEFVIILGLFLNQYPDFIFPVKLWIFLLLFSSMMVTYTKSAASEKKLVKREMEGGGLLEHPDRMLLILAIILVSSFSLLYASFLIVITTFLVATTAFQRFLRAIKR